MAGTTPLSDSQSVIGIVGPLSYNQTTSISTDFHPLNLDRRIQFITSEYLGDTETGTNVLGFVVQQAKDTNGVDAKPIAGLSVAGFNTPQQSAFVFDVRGADLDTNGFATCALVVTPSSTNNITLEIISLGDPEITPPTPAAVVQNVFYIR